MKNRKWLYLVLIILCLAVFCGYQIVDRIGTDSKAPEINISTEPLQISVQDPETMLLQGVSARDNADGDVTASLVVESVRLEDSDGTVKVRYAAFDKAGNVAKAEREVRYTDYEGPRFSLSCPLVFTQNSNFNILDVIGAQDALDGDISHRIRASSLDGMSVTAPGVHDVEFRVTNSLGDTVKLVLPVEVEAAKADQAELTLTDYLIYLEVGTAFHERNYLDSFTRNRETTSLRNGLPTNYTLQTTGEVDTGTPGVYSVDYKVTYTIGDVWSTEQSRSYTGYSRLIVVVEG